MIRRAGESFITFDGCFITFKTGFITFAARFITFEPPFITFNKMKRHHPFHTPDDASSYNAPIACRIRSRMSPNSVLSIN